jgi:carboxylesterase
MPLTTIDDEETAVPIVTGAEPYRHDGGKAGVLLCHGLTGSPASLRPWAEYLAAAGLTVDVPRLPGHGTTWQELNATSWQDWYAEAQRALLGLAERCEHVVLGGLSVGACLALRLAEVHGSAINGLVLVNPAVASKDPRRFALPLLRFVVPSLAGVANDIAKPGQDEVGYDRSPLKAFYSMTRLWRLVIADLPRVTQPLLLYRSANDHVIDPTGIPIIRSRVSSSDVTLVVLPDSYHVATLDYDAETIFAGSLDFVRRLVPATRDGG